MEADIMESEYYRNVPISLPPFLQSFPKLIYQCKKIGGNSFDANLVVGDGVFAVAADSFCVGFTEVIAVVEAGHGVGAAAAIAL